jgi:hypothetical protein
MQKSSATPLLKIIFFLGLIIFIVGCSNSSSSSDPSIGGTWKAIYTLPGTAGTVTITLTLNQSGSAVTGNGVAAFSSTTNTDPIPTITGSYIYPTLSDLSVPIGGQGVISGTMASNGASFDGTVNIRRINQSSFQTTFIKQ